MKKFIAAGLACLFVLAGALTVRGDTVAADAILGVWHTTDNQSEVRIFKSGSRYFGQIVSLADPNWTNKTPSGPVIGPKIDHNNPDPKLRQRPILGMEFMSDFAFAGKNHWNDGKIYDPENGKTYKCKLILKQTNELEVRGFVGFSIFGRTVTWTR